MTLVPSHFATVILFATFASIIFGITQRSTPKAMVRYGAYCFVLFLACCDRGQLAHVLHPALGLARRSSDACLADLGRAYLIG